MYILLILLGCHICNLLNDRINAAVNFIGKFNETNIDWFLSGGIKNPREDSISEAEKMAQQISKFEKIHTNNIRGNDWNYIYDTVATNTAENFIMVRNYLNNSDRQYNDIYVITSEFHHKRANKIAEKILEINPKWILGEEKLHDSEYWERIHIKNVDIDVNKALKKFLI
jgi:vancomycin permeability regulator SanA